MCITEYHELSEAMANAKRIEAAHRRIGAKSSRSSMLNRYGRPYGTSSGSSVAPMKLGNVQLKKLTKAEREMYVKEGRCFRFREKGHSARF